MIDYKEYAKQMRKNSIAINGILQVTEELWLQIADIIDDLAEKQIPKKPKIQTFKEDSLQYFKCPVCKRTIISKVDGTMIAGRFQAFCDNCGQALDWGQEE